MLRNLVALVVFSTSSLAFAQDACTIATVDFERAVTETREGREAQERLDAMYSSRKAEIDQMSSDLEADLADYQSRSIILTDDARAEAERALTEKQSRFEQTYRRYQDEMQQTYMTLLQDLDSRMRTLTEQIAREKACTVVIDSAALVYQGPGATDLTEVLIQRYDAATATTAE